MGLWTKQLDEGLHPVDAEFRCEDGAVAIKPPVRDTSRGRPSEFLKAMTVVSEWLE